MLYLGIDRIGADTVLLQYQLQDGRPTSHCWALVAARGPTRRRSKSF